MKKRYFISIISIMLLTIPQPVLAVDLENDIRIIEEISDDGCFCYSYGSTNTGNTMEEKEQIDKKLNLLSDKNLFTKIKSRASKNYTIEDVREKTYNGEVARSRFSSDVAAINRGKVEISGTSRDFWTGGDPYRADLIMSSDKFTFFGDELKSASLTFPIGFTLTREKTQVTCERNYPDLKNDYIYSHDYDGYGIEVASSSTGGIEKVRQDHFGEFHFGSKTISFSPNDSVDIW